MSKQKRLIHIIELSKLMCDMSERGATSEELSNVVEFFGAAINTELACDHIYGFKLLDEYHNKYSKK